MTNVLTRIVDLMSVIIRSKSGHYGQDNTFWFLVLKLRRLIQEDQLIFVLHSFLLIATKLGDSLLLYFTVHFDLSNLMKCFSNLNVKWLHIQTKSGWKWWRLWTVFIYYLLKGSQSCTQTMSRLCLLPKCVFETCLQSL